MQKSVIFDRSDGQDLRINSISTYLKTRFGGKVVKLSVDGGFTCPNRDGSKGVGGCAFCSSSGSGDMASGSGDPLADLDSQIALLSSKWPHAKYIAYFQSHTNTYAPVDVLRAKFERALSHPEVVGIAIATRPDCLPPEVVDYLTELSSRTFLWVELGLQSIHPATQQAMNLCYTTADYDAAVATLLDRGIRVVTHLILGLPGETREDMAASVRHVCAVGGFGETAGSSADAASDAISGAASDAISGAASDAISGAASCGHAEAPGLFGLKLHMFNLVSGSPMATTHPDYVSFSSIEEYIDTVIEMIELVPAGITLHRISGDAPRSTLIAPEWSYRKRTILNGIHKEMRRRDTWQGRLADPD